MNELQKVRQFHVWESSFDIYDWAEIVPNVVGTPINVIVNGLQKKTDRNNSEA